MRNLIPQIAIRKYTFTSMKAPKPSHILIRKEIVFNGFYYYCALGFWDIKMPFYMEVI